MPTNDDLNSLQKLIETMALLRSPQGCQWDRQQTPETLKQHILEEAYELLEAIDSGDTNEIRDELGDLLLQVVFQAQIFAERDQFGMHEVAEAINNKLIRRHPHIFADADHQGHEQRWEEIKQQERSERGQSNRLAQRIPNTLPALKRATKAARKLPPNAPPDLLAHMEQQLQHLKLAATDKQARKNELEEQLGVLLLNICKFAATTDLDPEEILRKKTTRLISEFDCE